MRVPFQTIFQRNLLTIRLQINTGRHNTNRRHFCEVRQSLDYNSLKVLFFGTDTFSLPSLKFLHNEWKNERKVQRLEVVTSFRAINNPVKEFAKQANLNVYDFKDIKARQESLDFTLGVVVSFGHMIPESIINVFPLGLLNVHASLLPKYRGAAPIIHAIRNGDTKTGVSIMRIAPKRFDIGDILLQKEFPLNDTDLMPQIHDRLAQEGAQMLIDCINNLSTSLTHAKVQNENEATYASKIDENFTQVRWDTMTAKDVHNLYRSLYSFKFVTTNWQGEQVKLKEISYDPSLPKQEPLQPGTVKYSHKLKCLLVFCVDGQAIQVFSLGNAKKSKMSARDFSNGFLNKRPESERRFI